MHGLVCAMRRKYGKNYDKYIFMFAGFVGGTASSFLLGKKTAQAIGLFLFVRALDFTYRSLVAKKKIK